MFIGQSFFLLCKKTACFVSFASLSIGHIFTIGNVYLSKYTMSFRST